MVPPWLELRYKRGEKIAETRYSTSFFSGAVPKRTVRCIASGAESQGFGARVSRQSHHVRAVEGRRAVPPDRFMALVEKSVLVNFTPDQMFRLVDRVEDYPAFLPWCGGSSVADRSAAKLRATVTIDYYRVRQSFTTENTRREPESIDVKLVDGPFRILDGSWQFKALGQQACKIEFRLHY